jgi:hypothetical protein
MAVAADGTLFASWLDSREGHHKSGTYLARITDRGTRVAGVVKLDGSTCPCCRVAVATGPSDTVVAAWRKIFPGDIRDMVLGVSRDGGRSFAPATLVHPDHWKINACPHRGGSLAFDARGRLFMTWYSEGADNQPRILFSVAEGGRFAEPKLVNGETGTVPDQARLAVDTEGRVAIIWQDSTAVRRRVLLRSSVDGGRTLSPPQILSQTLKAYAPDLVATPNGKFVVAWREERYPTEKTIIQPFHLGN